MGRTDSSPQAEVRELLFLALKTPENVARLGAPELDLLLQLTRRVRLHGRLCADLKRLGVFGQLPQVAQDQLDSALVMADARERVSRWELDRIARAVQEEPQLVLICMKGCAYLLLDLPNVPGRIFADVDLLTPEAQLRQVELALNRHGWAGRKLSPYDDNYYRRWTHELPPLVHQERDVEIDLHHNIVPRTSRLAPGAAKLIEKSREIAGTRYRVPCREDLALHAMVHLMFDSDLEDKLRDLLDIDEMLRHFSAQDSDFWPNLLARAGELGLTRPAYYSLRYCIALLHTPVPDTAIESAAAWAPPRPVRVLMDRLVPHALLPPHPERVSRITAVCRLLLYVRSHWLRMPPWLLAYHLSYKFVATRLLRRKSASD